jgi:hypothetical protein
MVSIATLSGVVVFKFMKVSWKSTRITENLFYRFSLDGQACVVPMLWFFSNTTMHWNNLKQLT